MAFWRPGKKWRIAVRIVVILFVYLVLDFFWNGSDIRKHISKETTFITEPLRKDGYPDYVIALVREMTKGITPENNAAVLFWKAIGPKPIPEEHRKRYFEKLGVMLPLEQGEYFVSHDKYFTQHEGGELKDSDTWYGTSTSEITALNRPWSKKEFPVLAAWLAANEKPMALLTEASKRTRRYDPLMTEEDKPLLAVPSLAGAEYRHVAQALVSRAMLRINDGDADGAWNDLLTCYRLSRLAAQDPRLLDLICASIMDTMANQGVWALLDSVKASADRVAKYRDEFERLPRLPKRVDKIDFGERYMCLDALATTARLGFSAAGRAATGDTKQDTSIWERFTEVTVDWAMIFRQHNDYYDRIVAAMRLPSRQERIRTACQIHKDMNSTFRASLLVNPCGTVSRWICSKLAKVFARYVNIWCEADDYGDTLFNMTRLSFALAAYRADRGEYPEKLADLTPKYIAELPKDIFSDGKDMRYRREKGDGYLLYSIGFDEKDNEGKAGQSWWDSDIAVRIPPAK